MPADGATAYDQLQNTINNEADRARDYIADRTDSFKTNVSQTISALLLASREYDAILKAKATKPLFGEIFVNLVVTLLPMANLVKVGASSFKLGEKAKKVVEVLNDKYIDLIKSFKEPMDQNNDTEESNTKEQNQDAASNDLIRQELKALFDLNNKIDELARNSRKYIRGKVKEFQDGTDKNIVLLAKIKNDFASIGLDQIKKISGDEFDTLAKNMLYDMLRKYVQTYVTFKIGDKYPIYFSTPNSFVEDAQSGLDHKAVKSKVVSDLPEFRDESLIDGIDQAQRDAIYKKFGDYTVYQAVNHTDLSRPSIRGYRDMIYAWNAKTVSAYSNKPIVFKVFVQAQIKGHS